MRRYVARLPSRDRKASICQMRGCGRRTGSADWISNSGCEAGVGQSAISKALSHPERALTPKLQNALTAAKSRAARRR